ncbi:MULTISPECIES: PepSY domain-containing protein [Rhodanobacter]|uniref:PepSY domain-containing protein n=1 Tax=Rhodanobacter TaxID=75309 RepID=UPI001C832AC0|nr:MULTISPECIES: PepSY domain-containing protein [Rhodanobacter]UJJ56325.1 PepSY domain-containing protein [Rhodanobacter thiooxydans]
MSVSRIFSMKLAFWARRAHRWIALIVGVQALLWTLSGLYMTAISIDLIHGDHLAHVAAEPLREPAVQVDAGTLSERYPHSTGFKLKQLMGQAVYELRQGGKTVLVDASTGAELPALGEQQVRQLASSLYRGDGAIQSVHLLEKVPSEVAKRPVPMWQANFSDRGHTTLYLSATTGELLARRHDFWRLYDFLWMFHIMDYETRSNVNNGLMRVAASIGLLFALSGIWLLVHSFRKRKATT